MSVKRFIFLSLFLCVIFSCNNKTGNQTVSSPTEAVIDYFEGEVLINNKEAAVGEKIRNKSTVSTGENSLCEIVFDNKNIIRILDNTQFELDFSEPHTFINLKQGTVTNVLTKLAVLADSDSFTIDTSAANLGVRGTSFFVKADSETTYVCVCNGIVTVKDTDNKYKEIIKAKHHSARLLTKTDSGIEVVPAAMLYHTDEDVERIAGKIGYKIDWGKIE